MIRVGIIGATGYTGVELVRFLALHPEVELKMLTSQSFTGQNLADIYPSLSSVMSDELSEQNIELMAKECDVVFTALPHGLSMDIVKTMLQAGTKVIDLGADFRLDDPSLYTDWYGVEHSAVDYLEEAFYGLPELYREQIKTKRLIANPGCYPTSSILGLAPVLQKGLVRTKGIVIDSKSGVSGAGSKASMNTHYAQVNDSIKAYGIASHRHTPEIEQELSKLAGSEVGITFTPHLTPMTRGILSTIYTELTQDITEEQLLSLYQDFYQGEQFVKVLPQGRFPETKWCYGSNYAFIGLKVDPRAGRLIVVSAIDNLVKGASGQAIQNMNLMFGLPEAMGIAQAPIFP